MKQKLIIVLLAFICAESYAQFGPQQIITTNVALAKTVYAADIDGDGAIDVLSASSGDHKIAWYQNTNGLGDFGPQNVIALLDQTRWVRAADLDGDNDIDVIASAGFIDLVVWYENLDGQGNFGPQQIISNTADGAFSVIAADLNGDENIDVVSAADLEDTISWYENDGNGNFGPEQIITTIADSAASVFATDLDNDGDIDVLSASVIDSKIAWYENLDGQGNFGPQQIISVNAPGTLSTFAADLDGDGDMDVLSASQIDHKIAWYENLTILGVATHNKPTIKVYPNPSKEIVFVEAKQGVITK